LVVELQLVQSFTSLRKGKKKEEEKGWSAAHGRCRGKKKKQTERS